ncbi:putative disease resistance RPP13-like protein [Drosera capensis]
MSKSIFVDAGRKKGSTGSSTSSRRDEDCSVDEDLVKRLVRKRNSILPLVNHAEERQFRDENIKEWLMEVKHAYYDVNTLLDRIDTEARFEELYEADGSSTSDTRILFKQEATSKINNLVEKLEEMAKDGQTMGLKAREEGTPAQQTHVVDNRITSPVRNKSDVVCGREKEKDQIMEWVLSLPDRAARGNKTDVIVIIGMGGMGKTTLAQYVYNHPEVEACFKRRSWACVSHSFDLVRVNRAILESLIRRPASFSDLAPLHEELKEKLRGERFLVVLDDVWGFSKQNWEKLMAPFSVGANGSKIIVTTRDRRVATAAFADYSFDLESMSEDDGWSLFSNDVFGHGEIRKYPKLEAIGKELVMKCHGLPLAIRTLSGLLRSVKEEVKWVGILESSFWQLPSDQNDIVPALGLSYFYLPSHLKACFAYCSLFPKGHRFTNEELVNLWIDEGFVQQGSDNRPLEVVGKVYFDELLSRSFFTRDYSSYYGMHDVIHDLAQTVYGDFIRQLEGHWAVKSCKKIRHLSYNGTSDLGSMKMKGLSQFKSLQTFMAHSSSWSRRWDLNGEMVHNIFFWQNSLRVLCLRGSGIRILPDTISNLKLLRCLDVSYTDVVELPASLGKLYHLRRLLCDGCDHLKGLYNDMSECNSLRRLTLSGKQLRDPPPNLSRLIECSIELELYLPYSVEPLLQSAPEEGILGAQVKIDKSAFSYSITKATMSFFHADHGNLLKSLRPHRELKKVVIEYFNGTRFPDWLVDQSYCNIETVRLKNCRLSSGSMPMLGRLPSLKYLTLNNVGKVTRLGTELYNCCDQFSSLEKLVIVGMEEWEEWEPSDDAGGRCFFPRLEDLWLVNCPRLKGRLPTNLPSLTRLVIRGCPSLIELKGYLHHHQQQQLASLEIRECGPRLVNPCLVVVKIFQFLKILVLGDCDSVETFPVEGSLPTSLTYLRIESFTKLKRLDVAGLQSLVQLEILTIESCPMLEALPKERLPIISSRTEDDEYPSNSALTNLIIMNCVKLKTLNGVWLQSFISLKEISIFCCPELEALPEEGLPSSLELLWLVCNHPKLKERCERDTGSYWSKIAHIGEISFDWTTSSLSVSSRLRWVNWVV